MHIVFGTCTPQDLTPSVLNQIARRDLHWLLLPAEHVLVYSACDLVQARLAALLGAWWSRMHACKIPGVWLVAAIGEQREGAEKLTAS